MTHPELIRHPFIDISNAPNDEEEQKLYQVYKFIEDFDCGQEEKEDHFLQELGR